MSNIVNKLYQNNSIIYKVILFLVATVAIVYLFPKGGQFKYDLTNGQLWKYDNLYAPFDFAIQKSAEEITKEKKEIEVNSKGYFLYDFDVEKNVNLNYNEIISLIKESDSLELEEILSLSEIGRKVIASIYKKGFLDVISQDRVSNKNEIVAIRKGNEVEDVVFKSFLTSKEVLELINKSLVTAQNLYGKKRMLDLLSEIIKPNVSFYAQYSQKVLENEIKNISYTKGKVVSGKLIILKGDIVEGKKLAILNSLKSESESQVWTESNYYWIILGYTILVSIALLMLLLFLKKYRVEIFENNNKVTFIFFNVFSMIFIQTLVIKFNSDYLYVVPLSILPIVLKAFFDPRLGLFTHVLTVLLLGYIVPDSFEFIYLHIIAGIVTILTVSEIKRFALLYNSETVSIVTIPAIICK